jgi:hypothetical protein
MIFGGMPYFAASQAALLFPINLLTFWLGPQHYWVAAAMLRLLLAAWGMFLLMGRLGARTAAAFASGAIYMLADFNVVWLHFAIHNVAALLPLALWLIHRALGLRAGRPLPCWSRETLALALVVAAQMLGGHPEMSLFFLVVCALFALGFAPWRARALAPIAGAVVLGLLLSAVQWLPTLTSLRASYTYEERSFAAAQGHDELYAPLGALRTAGWDTLRSWLLLAQPQLWGTPRGATIHNWGPAGTNYKEMTPYVGLAALALALFGVWRGAHRRAARFFGALLLGSLALLYPLPLLNRLGFLPLMDVAHGFRFGLSVALAAAVLAGLGIDRIAAAPTVPHRQRWQPARRRAGYAWAAPALRLSCDDGRRDLALLAGLCAALAALSATATALVASQAAGLVLGGTLDAARRSAIEAVFNLSNWRLGLPAAGALALGMAAWLVRRRPSAAGGRLAWLAAALVAAELLLYGAGYSGETVAADIYPATPATAMLRSEAPLGRVLALDNALWANTAMTQGIEVTGGMDDMLAGDQQRMLKRGMSGIALAHDRHVVQDWGRRLMDLMSVRYVVAARPVVERRAELPLRMTDGALRVYENRAALPRVYVAYSAVSASRKNAEDLVFKRDFDPHRAVVIEGDAPGLSSRPQRPIQPASIKLREPDRVQIQAQLDAPGVLVLTDAYDPGWQVHVDGRPAPLLRANAMFRGVALPAGPHLVEYAYRPAPVVWGAAISLCGLAILLLGALALKKNQEP